MILEVATLNIKPGMNAEFETAFAKARQLIASMPGCMQHELQKCLENPQRYVLLVQWRTLEDHTQGFRGSAQYQEWKALLHHFYEPFPVVEHYKNVFN